MDGETVVDLVAIGIFVLTCAFLMVDFVITFEITGLARAVVLLLGSGATLLFVLYFVHESPRLDWCFPKSWREWFDEKG